MTKKTNAKLILIVAVANARNVPIERFVELIVTALAASANTTDVLVSIESLPNVNVKSYFVQQ